MSTSQQIAPCSVSGCDRPLWAAKMCARHYRMKRKWGDINKRPHRAWHGEAVAFVRRAAECKDQECLIWPFARLAKNGYAHCHWEGRQGSASRVVCRLVNGEPPDETYDAAHSCGRGHMGCVNGSHLSWKTRAENIMDMVEHGTIRRGAKNPSSRLTSDEVIKIRELGKAEHYSKIAPLYGVAPSTIWSVLTRRSWNWLSE